MHGLWSTIYTLTSIHEVKCTSTISHCNAKNWTSNKRKQLKTLKSLKCTYIFAIIMHTFVFQQSYFSILLWLCFYFYSFRKSRFTFLLHRNHVCIFCNDCTHIYCNNHIFLLLSILIKNQPVRVKKVIYLWYKMLFKGFRNMITALFIILLAIIEHLPSRFPWKRKIKHNFWMKKFIFIDNMNNLTISIEFWVQFLYRLAVDKCWLLHEF